MLTIMSVVMFGALLGAMLPFLFIKLKLDPAVVSSPFIASLVDLVRHHCFDQHRTDDC